MITWRVELFGQLSRFRCKLPSLVGKPENRLPSSWDSQNCVWQPTNKRLNKKKKATLCPERTADWDRSPEDAFKLPAGFWWQIIFRQDIRLERKWQIRFSRKVWLKSTENEDELDFGNKLRKTNPFNWKNSCMELRLIRVIRIYTHQAFTPMASLSRFSLIEEQRSVLATATRLEMERRLWRIVEIKKL